MKLPRAVGWLLLVAGLAIIFYTLFSSYNIFTAKSSAPLIFVPAEKESSVKKGKTTASALQPEALLGEKMAEELKAMLPADVLPKMLNLVSWSIFASLLIFGGTQISGLGIKLIKN